MEHASWLESVTPDRSIPFMGRPPAAADLSAGGSASGPVLEDSIFDDLPVFADERSKVGRWVGGAGGGGGDIPIALMTVSHEGGTDSPCDSGAAAAACGVPPRLRTRR